MLNYWNNYDQPLLNCFDSITSPTRSLQVIPVIQQRPQRCNPNLNKTVSVSVTDDDTAPPATPSITSIRPPLQRPDDPVTIYGNHFGSTAGSVSFGGDSISIFSGHGYSWSNTSISLLIPGSLYAGQVSVSVTTNGGSTSNSYSYTVTGGPVSRGDCEEEGEDCPGDDKPKKDGSGGGDSEESEDPPGDGG